MPFSEFIQTELYKVDDINLVNERRKKIGMGPTAAAEKWGLSQSKALVTPGRHAVPRDAQHLLFFYTDYFIVLKADSW